MAFLFMLPTKCSQSRNPRGPDSGLHLPSPLPQARSLEPEACQVLLCDDPLEKAKGIKDPGPGPGQQHQNSPPAGGEFCHHHHGGWELGKLDAILGLEGNEKGGYSWGKGVFLTPCEGRCSGKEGRSWGSRRMKQALGHLLLCTWRPACK